jgi:hypothetical protein
MQLITLAHSHWLTASGVPDPGSGIKPPGADKLVTILGWVAWIVILACVGGILVTAARMALAHQRHESSQHVASLGWVMGACILVGSAATLVQALVV